MNGGGESRKRVEDRAIRGRDVLIAYMVGVFFWGASGVGVFAVVRELLPEKAGEPMPASGLFLILVGLMCFFIVLRWLFLLFVVGVTKAEIAEHDLWLGERRLVVGGVVTALPMLMAVFVFDADFVEGAAWLYVVGALLIIAPVTAWFGDARGAVGRIRKARRVADPSPYSSRAGADGGGGTGPVDRQKSGAKDDVVVLGTRGAEGSRGASLEVAPVPAAAPAAPVPVVVPAKFWIGMALGGGFFGAMWVQELRIKRWI